ncbi:hypothetical protein [Pseudonocardia sp.]|uniref:hypothetical protein n=1 Tax=Pseudonocardia sp. TaxID=60912 RepID=UPI0031FDB9F8
MTAANTCSGGTPRANSVATRRNAACSAASHQIRIHIVEIDLEPDNSRASTN